VNITVELGRQFAREAGASKRVVTLPQGATARDLLRAIAEAIPNLSCIEPGANAVDLGLANLSVNGQAVSPLAPEKTVLKDGDTCYLYGTISGG
jgi:molybdopterin converting factor small subunit